jgi:hypothetical protein
VTNTGRILFQAKFARQESSKRFHATLRCNLGHQKPDRHHATKFAGVTPALTMPTMMMATPTVLRSQTEVARSTGNKQRLVEVEHLTIRGRRRILSGISAACLRCINPHLSAVSTGRRTGGRTNAAFWRQ